MYQHNSNEEQPYRGLASWVPPKLTILRASLDTAYSGGSGGDATAHEYF